MTGRLRLICASLAVGSALASMGIPHRADVAEAETGLVIESLEKTGVGYAAGVRVGDRLVSWETPACATSATRPSHGLLDWPGDLTTEQVEDAPRCPVMLRGTRGADAVSFPLADGDWGLHARPALGTLRTAYDRSQAALSSGRTDDAIRELGQIARVLQAAGRTRGACWAWLSVAKAAGKAGRTADVAAAFETARALARAEGDRMLEAHLWREEANADWDANELRKAAAAFESALRLQDETGDDRLDLAATLHNLGFLLLQIGDLDRAEGTLRKAAALHESVAPEALGVARTVNDLGLIALQRGRLDAAAAIFEHARGIAERRGTAGLDDLGDILNNLALVARNRGDLALAQSLLERSLHIVEAREPGGMMYAEGRVNVAALAADRGDLERAEDEDRRALEIVEKLFPGSLASATMINNRGCVVRDRGDLDSAVALFRRALAIREALAPRSVDLATSYSDLGGVLGTLGDIRGAEECHRKALALREMLAPESQDVGVSLGYLASLAFDRGDRAEARRLLTRALTIDRKVAPRAPYTADLVEQMGDVALAQDDLAGAEALQREALAIRQRLMPGSAPLARSWHALSRVLAKAGRGREAAEAIARALDALEGQQGRLGGAEDTRSGFGASYAHLYRDAVELLVGQQRGREAFQALERSRARSLLALLAERDIVFADAAPELERERRERNAEYDRTQARIAELDPQKDSATVDQLLGRLRELRDLRANLESHLRAASPRLAALRYPRPLGLEGARAALDPGTVLLSYSVGRSKTLLFVVGAAADAFEIFELPVGEDELRKKVVAFRGLIEGGRQAAEASPDLGAAGAALYDVLLRPAERAVARAQRVLVSPDGPLHLLPFGALVTSRDPLRYLVEAKPVHTSVSVTLYAELKKARRAQTTGTIALAAFGDPTLPPHASQPPRDADGVTLRSARLEPLPWSRDEVHRIAGQFAPGAAEYLGADATEERAKALGAEPRYVHFATHGIFDRRFPLNSALVLAHPPAAGRENGLLQAWEIFESVRLDADLVTLSACETGLGREAGGEGLISLSRAFHYAGARSVLASLWSVSDRSTPDLMVRFYAGLYRGLAKDEALQAAQIASIRSGDARHPFHWAAFQLSGDWK